MKKYLTRLRQHLTRNSGQCSQCGVIFDDWNGGTCAACQNLGR